MSRRVSCIDVLRDLVDQRRQQQPNAQRMMLPLDVVDAALAEIEASRAHVWPKLEREFDLGDRVTKPTGYAFPGEIRAVVRTRGGDLRYVVEATGDGYAGMLHIFSEHQLVSEGAKR